MPPSFPLAPVFLLLCLSCSSPPEGVAGVPAKYLKEKIYKATNIEAWKKTSAVAFTWDGIGEHHYLWDRKRKLVEVSWDDMIIQYRQDKAYKGIVYIKKQRITDPPKIQKYIKKARKYFVNDAFWLNPIFHIDSPGTQEYKVSEKKLLVHFSSGGFTPGDSYLFTLKENGLVEKMNMWVNVLPIKGIEVGFENYITSQTEVRLALDHKVGFLNIQIKNLIMYKEYPPKKKKDPFQELLELYTKNDINHQTSDQN